jgi:hypothetical protein
MPERPEPCDRLFKAVNLLADQIRHVAREDKATLVAGGFKVLYTADKVRNKNWATKSTRGSTELKLCDSCAFLWQGIRETVPFRLKDQDVPELWVPWAFFFARNMGCYMIRLFLTNIPYDCEDGELLVGWKQKDFL